MVHDPKPPCTDTLDTVLANSKTKLFLIHCERHLSSRLPPSGGTWKYAKAPSTKNLDSLPTDMLLSAVSVLVAQSISEIPEELMKYPACRVARRNVPDFRRVFLMLKYTDIT